MGLDENSNDASICDFCRYVDTEHAPCDTCMQIDYDGCLEAMNYRQKELSKDD